jgi:hypothetical protein
MPAQRPARPLTLFAPMSDRPDLILARVERTRLRGEFPALFDDLSSLFFEVDPMGLNFEVNPDEYAAEVGTILPRVMNASAAAEIVPVLQEEFQRWFGICPGIGRATYEELAAGVLTILNRYRSP